MAKLLKSMERTRAVCALVLGLSLPGLASAQSLQPLSVGGEGQAGWPSLNSLPAPDASADALFAARLRAAPVTDLGRPAPQPNPQLVSLDAVYDAGTRQFAVGETKVGLDGLTAAIEALIVPEDRAAMVVSVSDAEGSLAADAKALTDALTSLKFGVTVVRVMASAQCGDDTLTQHLLSGIPDRAPFGDGDGTLTAPEAAQYAAAHLARAAIRGGDCAPSFSLILPADEARVLASVLPETADPRLAGERFEAAVLSRSHDASAIDTFLSSCTYCPAAEDLTHRQAKIEAQVALTELEDSIWGRIKDDSAPERFESYIETCTFCLHQDAAETALARLGTGGAPRPGPAGPDASVEEGLALAAPSTGPLGDSEAEALQTALASGDPVLIQSYLDNCTTCAGKPELTEALRKAHRREALRQPCVLAAGVPQLGGPRKLDDIAIDTALNACRAALDAFPNDPVTRTVMGRIAQAAGDREAAERAYVLGMADNVPSAYGLAAYLIYTPETGPTAPVSQVESLAAEGAKRGDWLSMELLSVLYSKGLVRGKDDTDAFDLVMRAAEDGNTLAQFFVGYYYLEGMGVARDETAAAQWLERAVRMGYTPANAYLAGLLETGSGTAPAPDRAAELYWRALVEGDPMARTRIVRDLDDRDRAVVRFVQGKLRDANVYYGQIDGIVGRGTRRAIETFAQQVADQR